MLDPTRTTLRLQLDSGRTLAALWLAMGSVTIAEAAARAKPDCIVFDLQHGLWERQALEAAIGLMPAGIGIWVRVAENREAAISQALDAGAEGIIVPLVEKGKEARRAVAACRFPPEGIRSGGGVRPLSAFNSYFDMAGRRTVVAVMIETRRGVRNAAKIARTDGLDMVFIGTGDLAISLGEFPAFGLPVLRACAEVHDACKERYLPCGIFTPNPEIAALRSGHGYRMVVAGNDIDVVHKGFAAAVDAFRARPAAT
jgi:2-keto-3-deoxy-L-rhamnonate aldolase RhmA